MIGEQIRALRKANNLTEVQLAKKLNVSKQSVSNWECNNIMPSVEQVKRLAILFGCSTDYLLELDGNGRIIIEKQYLSEEQSAHIVQLVNDIKDLNKRAE